MGCDICYTNHAEADQDDMDTLLTLLAAAGLNYAMGIPGCDDVMLGYQTTSFHDILYARQLLGLRPAPEFEAWLEKMKIFATTNFWRLAEATNSLTTMNTPSTDISEISLRANSLPNAMGGADPWVGLQKYTSARIGIGRAGAVSARRRFSISDLRTPARATQYTRSSSPKELRKNSKRRASKA